ncbi:MAG TPA: lysine--tRNA ligase [Acidimicrobiales bacterium]|nr:lysine--tRNA ligase [Acidimicrobiales bacterium]
MNPESPEDQGVPYRFERTAEAAALQSQYDDLEPGSHTGDKVSVAGRLMLRRVQGKVAFGTLADSSGRIQLFANAETTPRFDEARAAGNGQSFCELNLGDWIGVRGEVMTTRRGELSVMVEEWVRLAEARRQFPDKWHGLADVDTRYRQRYVDLWVTDEARRAALDRSRMVSLARRWFERRGYVEVETPVLQQLHAGAKPFTTHHNALDIDLFLRIAPELHLKRLVVGGFEKVFEIARVFRNEGISPRHGPEFTMLEAYEAYADYTDMMVVIEELVAHLATELRGSTQLEYEGREIDLTPPWRRATMLDLVEEHTGHRLSLSMGTGELGQIADELDVHTEPSWGPGKLILEIYEKTAEPNLWGPIFVIDYPLEVSPLARAHRSEPGFVERFEAVVAGRELANAFSELIDPDDQRARFEAQVAERAAGDDEAMAFDYDYVRALEYGLPPTAGLGIGIDRLAMLLTGATNIRDVILFPTMRPESRGPEQPSERGDG